MRIAGQQEKTIPHGYMYEQRRRTHVHNSTLSFVMPSRVWISLRTGHVYTWNITYIYFLFDYNWIPIVLIKFQTFHLSLIGTILTWQCKFRKWPPCMVAAVWNSVGIGGSLVVMYNSRTVFFKITKLTYLGGNTSVIGTFPSYIFV